MLRVRIGCPCCGRMCDVPTRPLLFLLLRVAPVLIVFGALVFAAVRGRP